MKYRIGLLLVILFVFILPGCAQIQQFSPENLPFVVTRTPDQPLKAESTQLIIPTSTATPIPASAVITFTETTNTPATASIKIIILPSASETQAVIPTSTYIPFQGTPIETRLPDLTLPTLPANAPIRMGWTGLPTYQGDSENNLLFRVDYNPVLWAQTRGNFGDIVLANRQIQNCIITPGSGYEMPVDWKVDHQTRMIGSASFEVNTAILQDSVQFASYIGGDGNILTGFQVTFYGNSQACLDQAEAVFGSLRSFASIPTPTPSASPIPKILLSSITPTP